MAEDQLFATLDPTMRADRAAVGPPRRSCPTRWASSPTCRPRWSPPSARRWRRWSSADLILHVRDIAHPDTEAQKRDVETVLDELGIDAEDRAARMIEVWNKIDLLTPEQLAALWAAAGGSTGRQPALRSGGHRAGAAAGGRGPAARGEADRGGARPRLQLRRARGVAAPARRGARADRRRHRPSSEGCNRRTRACPARPQARPAGLAAAGLSRPRRCRPKKSRLRRTAACEWGRKRLKSGVVGGTPWTQPHSALRLIGCQGIF